MVTKTASIAPYIQVRDPQATIAWFEQLEFTCERAVTMADGQIAHAEVARGPLRVMLSPVYMGCGSEGMSLYVTLDEDIDAYHDRVVRAGATVTDPLTDQFWGDRTFSVRHPDGYSFMFAQEKRAVSLEELRAALVQMEPAGATA